MVNLLTVDRIKLVIGDRVMISFSAQRIPRDCQRMIRFLVACFLALPFPISSAADSPDKIASEIIAPLLDPVKVARVRGGEVSAVIDKAQAAGR